VLKSVGLFFLYSGRSRNSALLRNSSDVWTWEVGNNSLPLIEPSGQFNCSSIVVGISSISTVEYSLLPITASPTRVTDRWTDCFWLTLFVEVGTFYLCDDGRRGFYSHGPELEAAPGLNCKMAGTYWNIQYIKCVKFCCMLHAARMLGPGYCLTSLTRSFNRTISSYLTTLQYIDFNSF
jgi:hypothetical protein